MRLILTALTVAVFLLPSMQAAAQNLRIERLRCEYMENPVGIDVVRPRLYWRVASTERGQKQTAYQVLAASTEAALKANKGDLWDSGKIASDKTVHIAYSGAPLRSRQRVFWKVRVWDKGGRDAGYSRPAFWEMGLLDPAEWKAQWITASSPESESAPFRDAFWLWSGEGDARRDAAEGERFFRKRFTIPEGAKVKTARLALSVDDQFTAYVNGKEAGKSSGQPDAWRKPASLDVTALLTPGPNVIAIAARNTAHGGAGVLGKLIVTFEGRAPLTIATDKTWKVSNATAGEGWRGASLDDASWSAAREVAPFGQAPWGTIAQTTGPGRYLRREFTLSGKPIREARLYATALGVYEPYLNGKRVGRDIFAPGWTDYKKRVYYQTYDVTGLLKQNGGNAIGVIVGDGWYSGHVGLAGRGVYGMIPFAACQLRIDYADGTSETIATDETWRGTTAGPIVASDMLMGETYDARREMPGWSAPGFAGKDWQPVVTTEEKVLREAQRGPSVLRFEALASRKVTQPKPNVHVFDLGQNLVGWARLKVKGPAGAKVTLRFAEMLNPDGTVYTTNYRGARCTDEYTLRGGKDAEVYEPHFTFRGFRYVEVTGLPPGAKPAADMIAGVVVHSDTPRVGTMETSSPMVNQLLANIDWGQRGNFLSVPTDCPQRDERLGWMGDAQIFVRTSTYNRDVASFFTKWMVDVEDAQPDHGGFTDVVPFVAAGAGTAAWADAGVIVPWTIYEVYGDTRILEEHYEGMKSWLTYCTNHSKDFLRPAEGYGDWLSIAADTPKDVLSTAYFAHSARLTANVARVLGKTADADKYGMLFEQIRDAFNRAYIAADGRIKGNTQTAYLLALRFDLLPLEKRAQAARYLVEDIAARNGHLSTGFVGVGYMNPTLTQTGNTDVAYRLLLNETFPSWGYTIKHGATTIWERWDGWTAEKGFQDPGMNSFNHYAFGSVGEWLFDTVAGIDRDPAQAGFQRLHIKPQSGPGLTHAKAEYDSLHGRIATSWRIEGGRFTLDVTIPANTTATVRLPTASAEQARTLNRSAESAVGVRFLREEPGVIVYQIDSGTYRFAAPAQTSKVAAQQSPR